MMYRDLRLGLRDWEWTGLGAGIRPRADRLEITGWPPAILNDVYIEPANDNLTMTGHAPVAGVSQFVAPGVDALTVTGLAPTPVVSEVVEPGADSLTVTGYAPTVSGVSPTNVEPGNDTLVITGDREYVVNGTFESADNWTENAWTISGGEASVTNLLSGSANALIQTLSITAGVDYIVEFEITSYTAGGVVIVLGGNLGTTRTAVGTYTETITAGGSHTNIQFHRSGSNFTGSIDNVSVKLAEPGPTVIIDQVPAPGADTLVVTGYAPLAPASEVVTPGADTLSITEYAPTIETGDINTNIAVDNDTLVVTGLAPAVSISIPVANDTLVITGSAPNVSTDTSVAPGQDSLAITGYAPTPVSGQIVAPGADALTIGGGAAGLTGPTTLYENQWFNQTTTVSFTTGSFTPSNNSLLVACVLFSAGADSDPDDDLTCTTSGVTWTLRASGNLNWSQGGKAYIYTAEITTGSSMTVTAERPGGAGMFHPAIYVYEFTGYDTTTPIGVTGSHAAHAQATGSLSVSLSGTSASDSVILAAIYSRSGVAQTPGTGWTELVDTQISDSISGSPQAQYYSGATSTAVWDENGGGRVGAAAVEVQAGAGVSTAPTVITDQVPAPANDTLVITGYAPSIAVDQFVAPGQDSLIITEYAPTVSTGGGSTTHTLTIGGRADAFHSIVSSTTFYPNEGDLIVVQFLERNGNSYTNYSISDTRSGTWNLAFGYDNALGDSGARHAVALWYRIATASDQSLGVGVTVTGTAGVAAMGMVWTTYRPSAAYNYAMLGTAGANGTGASGNDLTTPVTATTSAVSGSDLFVLSLAFGRKSGTNGFDEVNDVGFANATEDYSVLNNVSSERAAFARAHREGQSASSSTFSDSYDCNNTGIEGTVAIVVFEDGI